jgi:glycosyltransferase involved in cell wall biosynthesis
MTAFGTQASPPSTALIIPALNEAPVIGRTLAAIPPGRFDLIIVADNGSSDGTPDLARQAGAHITVQPERGYGATCLKALAALPESIEIVVFMQADLSEDPAQAAELVRPLQEGRADLIIGSRVLGRCEAGALLPHQRFGNWLATTLMRILYGHSYTDLGPFRAITRNALERIGMQDRNYGWTIEMQVRALEEGLRVLEVPVSYKVRAAGQNKVSGNLKASIKAGIIILSTIVKLWWRYRRSASRPEIQSSFSHR